MALARILWHAQVSLGMKVIALFGVVLAGGFLLSGCASTDSGPKPPKVDHNARWIIVSTNEPVSSARMEQNSPRVPARQPSYLLTPEGQQARQEIETNGVPPILKKKMLDGDVLTLADIEDLARYKVSEGTILKYIQTTAAIYVLTTDDINRLQAAGVTKPVSDYMLATVNQRPVEVVRRVYRPYPYYSYDDPWWGYPYYHHYYWPRHYHYHHYHHHGGHHHRGGGIRVYRGR